MVKSLKILTSPWTSQPPWPLKNGESSAAFPRGVHPALREFGAVRELASPKEFGNGTVNKITMIDNHQIDSPNPNLYEIGNFITETEATHIWIIGIWQQKNGEESKKSGLRNSGCREENEGESHKILQQLTKGFALMK
jgi:hypothetical protein